MPNSVHILLMLSLNNFKLKIDIACTDFGEAQKNAAIGTSLQWFHAVEPYKSH